MWDEGYLHLHLPLSMYVVRTPAFLSGLLRANRDEREHWGLAPVMAPAEAAMSDGDQEEKAGRARPAESAARDHLANERTLLAWARTSIAVMALGFVVARFGLLIRELGALPPQALQIGTSTAFGVALTVGGALLMGIATVRYARIGRMIERGEFRWSSGLGLALGAVLVVVAVLLAVYLLVSA